MGNAFDKIGIALSGLCLAHCLLVPALILLLPALSFQFFENEWIHWVLIACAIPVSLYAFIRGLRCHKCWHPGLIGLTGLLFLIAGVLLAPNETMEVALTVAGAVLLATGHVFNQRSVRLA